MHSTHTHTADTLTDIRVVYARVVCGEVCVVCVRCVFCTCVCNIIVFAISLGLQVFIVCILVAVGDLNILFVGNVLCACVRCERCVLRVVCFAYVRILCASCVRVCIRYISFLCV